MVREQGYNLFLGAFAALASYALFPLSWIAVSVTQQIANVLTAQTVGAALGTDPGCAHSSRRSCPLA